jgi:uncharacterized protein (TIRG00374 family)
LSALVSRLLRIGISIGLLALVIRFADWRAMLAVLRNVNLVPVVFSVVLSSADRIVIVYRWQILLVAQDVVVSFAQLFRVQLAANFLGSFLPGFIGVDAVRAAALYRAGMPAARTIAAVLVDRVTIAVATVIFGSVMVLMLARSRLPHHLTQFVLLMAMCALVAVVMFLSASIRRWVRFRLLSRVPERFRQTISQIADASLAYRHQPKTIVSVAVATLFIFVIRLFFAKAIALSCGVNVPFADLLLVIPVLWIIVMLPITVGNIGVQDAGYVLLMSVIGVGAPVAASMSLVEHVVARLVSLPGVLFLHDVTARSAANQACPNVDDSIARNCLKALRKRRLQ